MDPPSEHTPLLRSELERNARRGSVYSTLTNEDVEIVDDSPDLLLSRYDSYGSTLGVNGNVGLFGTSLSNRRGSVSFSNGPLVRAPGRSERLSFSYVPEEGRDSKHHILSSSDPVMNSVTSGGHRPSFQEIEDIVSKIPFGKRPKYFYGVSTAQFWACYSSIFVTAFVVMFDSTLMASSHPVITSYFDASYAASWLSTSFLLTVTAIQPLFGRISDTFGRKVPLIICLGTFILGTAGCALAQSIIQFILARAVCGIGAGGAITLGSIISNDLIPMERRGSYVSIITFAYGTGSSLGAGLGGFLADNLGWRWEFGMQVPAIFLCLVIACLTVPSNLGPNLAKQSNQTLRQAIAGFDLTGSILLTTTITLLILGLNLGGSVFPWSSPFIIASFVLAIVCGNLLFLVERRVTTPVLPLPMLMRIPAALKQVLAAFLSGATMNTIMFNAPLYFQAVLLDTPSVSGARLLIPFLTSMVATFITGNYITWSQRLYPTLIVGLTLTVLGSISLATMSPTLPQWIYSWLISLATMGQGLSFPTLSLGMLAVTSAEDMAVAMTTLGLFRSLGTIMGIALSSLVMQSSLIYYLERMVHGVDKEAVVREVTRQVSAIAELDPWYREQVIGAYSAALHVTFTAGAVPAVIALLLVLFVKLPRLV